ncbi:MAG: hypothetical protein JNM56_20325 [Planctomycetia bacterium]|nr:hypothetical protein [Planctomycetia bacterium]
MVVLDTRCSWGRVAAAAFAENTATAQQELLREETAVGLVPVPEALRVLGAQPCETNFAQWRALDRLARALAPDTGRLLALPLPAPWFFVLLVEDDRLHLSVVPTLPGG